MGLSYFTRRVGKLGILRWRDAGDFFKILAACPCGLILRLFRRHIWIVSEMEHTARDNGYWFFRYMRENYPDRPVYYPIRPDAPDYEKAAALGHVIRHGSFRHHVLTWAARMDISDRTGKGLPGKFMSRQFQMMGLYPFKEVFLQHGVTINLPPYLLKENNRIDLFLAANDREAESICTGLHYSPEQVAVTGFARYDNLNEFTVDEKLILVMPTWRSWLNPPFGKTPEETAGEVEASEYVGAWRGFLEDPRLHGILEERDLHLLFFPHNMMQPFLSAFSGHGRIRIADTAHYDVQEALKRAAYLITDYSSIFFDFAYMGKPMCYYQFDYEEFRAKHYPEGYFSYSGDGFGPVVTDREDLLRELERAAEGGFRMEPVYAARCADAFKFRDGNNCRRILQAVEDLEKRGGRRR